MSKGFPLMSDRLVVVAGGQPLPEPPYPAEVRARGWPFTLDTERIRQSRTWRRAPPEIRPWLLMLWFESWSQAPCGSLPADDEDIASIIGMPAAQFAVHRASLLAGWVKHSDGLLYHRVITELVWSMMGKRRRDAEYVAAKRLKDKESPRVETSRSESSADTALHSSALHSSAHKPTRAKTPMPAPPRVNFRTWADWCKHRGAKLTPIAYNRQCEFLATQPDPNACVEQSLRNGWAGLFEYRTGAQTDEKSKRRRQILNGLTDGLATGDGPQDS